MKFNRACGILLHPTSLPGEYGIGDLGSEAYEFIDFLEQSKQKLWQILPLNPPGYGQSPFQCFSAFAGNYLLISPDKLVEAGLLSHRDVVSPPALAEEQVQFTKVAEYKEGLFKKAYKNFQGQPRSEAYVSFVQSTSWLKDYAMFMALKGYFRGKAWNYWEREIALRSTQALARYEKMLQPEIEYYQFLQFVFLEQWQPLKAYANGKGIKIIGDLPIFISYDSSDAWANPLLFELDELGNPTRVAGVPPDYFSKTGQLWGNPHYRWQEMEKDDFSWWRARFKNLLAIVDIVRIDHFRGFEAYWEIPAGEDTAINGRWVKAPGEKLFRSLKRHLGDMPLIAEDLGVITPEVEKLKNKFGFPGMKILQFNLHPQEKKEFLPLNYEANAVVYTGTHDNDTTLGWYQKITDPDQLEFLQECLQLAEDQPEQDICWQMIKLAYRTRANTAIIPLQDILCLGGEARMNFPGTVGGNWQWRFKKGSLTPAIAEKLSRLAATYHR